MRTLLAALLAVLACVCAAAAPAPVLPRAQGYVNDFAGILDSAARENLTALLTRTERDTGAEIAVVTVESLDGMSVEEYASRLFAAWGIGKKGRDNGVLVLVAPNQRQMRIEVGYGLEPVLPDGLAGEIIRADFLPRFRENRYNDGIVAGVADLVAIVRRGEPASRSGRPDPPHSPLAMTLFFSLFVAAGAFAVGAGLTSRTIFPIVWGAGFGGIPLVMAFVPPMGASRPFLLLLAGSALVFGMTRGRKQAWQQSLRGKGGAATPAAGGWVLGTSSGGSSGGSSSGGLGGGSSGGGGASGSW